MTRKQVPGDPPPDTHPATMKRLLANAPTTISPERLWHILAVMSAPAGERGAEPTAEGKSPPIGEEMAVQLLLRLRVMAPTLLAAVITRGEEFELVRRPTGLRKRAPKACFANAMNVVMAREGLLYAEGFALTYLGWFHHAWVVDGDDHAIEVTWEPPGLRYVGVTLTPKEAAQRITHPDGGWGSCFDLPVKGRLRR